MDKKLINEDIKNMKYLFGYKPGRVISEQVQPELKEYDDENDYWTQNTTMDNSKLGDNNNEKLSDEKDKTKDTQFNPFSFTQDSDKIKSYYNDWLAQKSDNPNDKVIFIKSDLKSHNDMVYILETLKTNGWPLCKLGGSVELREVNSLSKTFDFIKIITGDLLIHKSDVSSLGALTSVWGNIRIQNSSVETLGDLEEVGKNIVLSDCPINNIDNLRIVGKTIAVYDCENLKSLGSLEEIGANLIIRDSNIESFGNLKSVNGYMDIANTPLSKQYTEHMIRQSINMRPTRSIKTR